MTQILRFRTVLLADWNMFRDSSNGIEEYTTSVTGFISKCIVPTVTVCTFPNQKPWITGNIHSELKARAATFKERDTNPDTYKKSRYALRRTIRHQYRTKIESYYTGSDTCQMWQGSKNITDYKAKLSRELPSASKQACMRAPAVPDNCVITLSVTDVIFKQVNVHKAAEPEITRTCAHRETKRLVHDLLLYHYFPYTTFNQDNVLSRDGSIVRSLTPKIGIHYTPHHSIIIADVW
jgi:hypothetical protein